jgi:hypothetical protein
MRIGKSPWYGFFFRWLLFDFGVMPWQHVVKIPRNRIADIGHVGDWNHGPDTIRFHQEFLDWCSDNLKGWSYSYFVESLFPIAGDRKRVEATFGEIMSHEDRLFFIFNNEEDAFLFKMRW